MAKEAKNTVKKNKTQPFFTEENEFACTLVSIEALRLKILYKESTVPKAHKLPLSADGRESN